MQGIVIPPNILEAHIFYECISDESATYPEFHTVRQTQAENQYTVIALMSNGSGGESGQHGGGWQSQMLTSVAESYFKQ